MEVSPLCTLLLSIQVSCFVQSIICHPHQLEHHEHLNVYIECHVTKDPVLWNKV